jgi:threonyl-tRNA synthetase
MPQITLPDGSVKSFDRPVTGLEVAASIGPKLAQAALGCKINGELSDLSSIIQSDVTLSIVTEKTRDKQPDKDGLYLIRHTAAHIMAEAIQDVLGKDILLAYGPPTENGFYYDMFVPAGKNISTDHFDKINARMAEIIKENRAMTRYEMSGADGLAKVTSEHNKYKIDNAQRAIVASPGAKLTFYANGAPGTNWEDLCRGPHVPSTGRVGAVKVMSVASSYWHGDENSDRLTRVYGTAFATQAELDAHLNQLEEARKRDHRVIGRNLHLFHIDEMVGQGLVLWTPAGSVLRQELQDFIGGELRKQGYHQVFTPEIGRLELYKTSGHFPYYKDSQYPPIIEREALELLSSEGCSCAEMLNRVDGVSAKLASDLNARWGSEVIEPSRVIADDKLLDGYMLRPMNCPHHIRIFASRPHSYRDLPVRLAEFGTVYRWEQSGELNGMTRVRGFTQDDAHLFCTEEQVPAEIMGCLSLVKTVLTTLKMADYRVRVGLRDRDGAKYIGSAENWDRAENACRDAVKQLGLSYTESAGEAAFYGPKIDFLIKDVIGREWQLGTVQVDYNLPIRFDLSYIGQDNKPHRPVMIHRAPFGSFERFCGVLIEHFAGAFPTWLSPEQVRVLPISDKSTQYANTVLAALKERNIRATMDDSNERVQAKIKVAADGKVPYLLVVGPRDAESSTVSVRARGVEKDLGAMSLTAFVDGLTREIAEKRAELTVKP